MTCADTPDKFPLACVATVPGGRCAWLQKRGHELWKAARTADAELAFREALRLAPERAELLTDLGNLLRAQNRLDEARALFLRVLEQEPGRGEAWSNLGTVAHGSGQFNEALADYQRALALIPGHVGIWGNLVASMNSSPLHSPAELRGCLRRFDAQLAGLIQQTNARNMGRDARRRLRVGYVSPDFRKHPVAYFLLPLLEGHDREQVEVFCCASARQEDEGTRRIRAACEHWIACADLSDEELARRIRDDSIDILVDLAGHTENGRLLVFARKPVPVQVTWLGYVTTTGLSAIDWRVTHADADPTGCEADYSEKLWRLPGAMWCYRPLPGMPEVSSPPLARKGHVTFGSFNRYAKNSQAVLEAWAEILQRVPGSRLLICMPEGQIREQLARIFSARGVHSDRITGFNRVCHEEFWKLHAEVDIALDPFPFGGGTTSCETLWLGVPLITCTGREGDDFAPRFSSRMGYALLNSLGLPELAAETVSDYIATAVNLAGDRKRLAGLRQSLRPRMASAALTDEKRFVREMEAAYRAMWNEYVNTGIAG